MMGYFFIYLFI